MQAGILCAGFLLLTALIHGLMYLFWPLADGSHLTRDFYYPCVAITVIVIIICVYLTLRQLLFNK